VRERRGGVVSCVHDMDGTAADGGPSSGRPVSKSPASLSGAELQRARRLFLGLCAIYACALLALYALGLFGFLWKTVVVPSLFIVAYLAGRFRAFVRDWAVFLGAVALFDSCRGLIYGVIQKLELPVYMHYAIAAERALFGGTVPSVTLQRALFAEREIGTLEKSLVVVHASHFLMFLCFALLVWLVRTESFARFKLAMVIVMYAGITCYLIAPTVPPWMASNRFYVLPEITQMPRQIYNLSVPTLAHSFDTNPIAAMPSLHTAFPALLTLVCFHHFGRVGLAMLVYLALVMFGIVYMGEHYVVDVLGGFALAVVAYVIAYRWPALAPRLDAAGVRAADMASAPSAKLGRPLLGSAALLLLAQGAGFAGQAMQERDLPTAAFIARELDGRSPMANYYRALSAYYAGDHRQAQPLFARARFEVSDALKQQRAIALLGETAFRNGDHAVVTETLGTIPKLSPEQALMLAEARLERGQHEVGYQVLDFVSRSLPHDQDVQRRKAELERRFGR
jgi:membrane-associated phospholipid phosphatase